MKSFCIFFSALLLAGRVFAAAEVYTVDPSHSSVDFSTKHMMVSTVSGRFSDFQGTLAYDPADPSSFKADFTIQAKSIDTNQEKRDEHLRAPEFFDTEKFPTIKFVSKSLTGSNGAYTLTGDLTVKDVTKEVTFPVTISGPVKNPKGEMVIGLGGQLTINRQDYGITWSKTLDGGGLMVSDNVAVSVNLEADKK